MMSHVCGICQNVGVSSRKGKTLSFLEENGAHENKACFEEGADGADTPVGLGHLLGDLGGQGRPVTGVPASLLGRLDRRLPCLVTHSQRHGSVA